jgi:hypothetical protein
MLAYAMLASMPRVNTPALFWEKITIGGPDDCWPWEGWRGRMGHGQVRWLGRKVPTHQLALALSLSMNGPPIGWYVMHRCDNPPCCNPAHLMLGTPATNSADMVQKGRSKPNNYHKVTDEQLSVIRDMLSRGLKQSEIACEFGVHQGTISRIATGSRRRGRVGG